MNTYKLILQYRGTQYFGFQVQPNKKTIQSELNHALKQISKSDEVKSLGSGRTDAGVHALGQVVKIDIPIFIPEDRLCLAINSFLPDDILVLSAEICQPEFHPVHQAKSKEYNYVFTNEKKTSPFVFDLVSFYSFELDIELMKKGCHLFLGEHDFFNYQCTGTDVKSSVRSIYSCDLIRHQSTGHWSHWVRDYYVFKIEGSGFLKQMVRLIMGALWNLGRHKITLLDIEESLNPPPGELLRKRLGQTAPCNGLYLKEVHY